MKIVFFTYSRHGCNTVRKIRNAFADAEQRAYTVERFCEQGFLPYEHPTETFYGKMFDWADAMIFVCSCGIAVREIAPFVKDKCKDPAVICIDDAGTYVIPILSGHIGGANSLARKIAETLCATAVITTATDVHNKFSPDAWAAKNNYVIGDMTVAKAVLAEMLEKNIPLICDLPVVSSYPNGVEPNSEGELGIYIGWKEKSPFIKTLHLIPRVLHLGIGCRKGTDAITIGKAVDMVLKNNCIDKRAIKQVASIDLKSDEAGLLEYCRVNQWQVTFYSASQLQAVKGDFTASSFVKSVTGVDNVCERAAMIGGDRLIVKKTPMDGVTVAIATENAEVCFE